MKLNKNSRTLLIITLYYTVLLGNNELINNSIVNKILTYGILVFPCLFILSMFMNNYKNFKFKNMKKIPLILSIVVIVWNIITIVLGINIGMHSIKAMIMLVVVLALLNIIINIDFTEDDKEKILDHFLVASFISMILGILQYFTGFKLNTFDNNKYPGILGRINSTFYIATLYDKFLVLTGAVICYKISREKFNYKYLLLLLVSTITITITFSRSGIIIYIFILAMFLLINIFKKRITNILAILICLGSMLLIPGSKYVVQSGIDFVYSVIPVPNSLRIQLIKSDNTNGNKGNNEEENKENYTAIEKDSSIYFRDYYKLVGKQFVKENPILGIGYGGYAYLYNNQNAREYLKDTSVLGEYDYMYPHSSYVQVSAETGIVGLILLYGLMVILLIYAFKSKDILNITLALSLILALLFGSYTEGLFNAKQYILIFIILYAISCNNHIEKKRIKNNKLSFLLLHLGYGGIETSTINTANSLCDKYEIELVSFYKLKKNQTNRVDDRVKIRYLYDGEPNREEFLDCLKNKKIFGIFKEGLKSASILIKKKVLVIRYIIHCDSLYIVSTRWEFSTLLSKYGNNYSVKIAQEHHYHNNDQKYINTIKKKYNNIDYLFALTKTLEKDYKEFLKDNNTHTKVVLVPNMLYEIPNKDSKLKDKNIITVSRLDIGKKNDDIIRAFSKIKEKDWKLYIIGDGAELENLKKLVEELKLTNRVILTGYKDKNEIEEYMLKSSLFLMASLTEGLPMVLLEAMSYGIPCISYETASGISDIIEDNTNGFIIKDRNEEEYINKIEKLLKDEKLRVKFGKEAKKTANDFSKEKITDIWLKILK